MTTLAIGVDLGGTNLRIAAVDSTGKVLEKITTDTKVARGRDQVIDEMCVAIQEIVSKQRGAGELAGIGIGVPGIIEMQTGMLRESPNLPGWHNYPVRDEIQDRLRTTVVLENDANAAAMGEKWLGAAAGVDDMCMFTLGTGVGGGVVMQGLIWHGMTGMAGELGHINVELKAIPAIAAAAAAWSNMLPPQRSSAWHRRRSQAATRPIWPSRSRETLNSAPKRFLILPCKAMCPHAEFLSELAKRWER